VNRELIMTVSVKNRVPGWELSLRRLPAVASNRPIGR